MRSSWVLAIAIAACSPGADRLAAAAPPPDRIGVGVPLGGTITAVAMPEQADAALTLDTLGELRLWPSLDGRRPPVPVAASAPAAVALGHAGDDLLAAILDDAGGARLVRLGRDGAVRGRAQLPVNVAYVQLVAIDGGVLARAADESIERFDAGGVSRGRLVAEPGERIATIAVRHGSAIALIGNELRWIVVDDGLRWGTRIKLPAPVLPTILALSPDHRRVAAIHPGDLTIAVYDLQPIPVAHPGPTVVFGAGAAALGFVDNDHVAAVGSGLQWWAPSVGGDPWAPSPANPGSVSTTGGGAVGDGLAVAGSNAALALGEPSRTRYLGWQQLGGMMVADAGSRLAVSTTGRDVVWLDDALGRTRWVDLDAMARDQAATGVAVGDHHVIVQTMADSQWTVELRDLDHPGVTAKLGKYPNIQRIEYFPAAHAVAIVTAPGVVRYEVDLAHTIAKLLPPLTLKLQVAMVRLLDPHHATVIVFDNGGERAIAFDDDVAVATPTAKTGMVSTVDAKGTTYVVRDGSAVVAERAGVELARFEAHGQVVSASHDTTHLAVVRVNEVAMLDASGVELWHVPLWGASAMTFAPDDRHVVVVAPGGLVSLDVATGARVAASCGWGFGLYDQPLAANPIGQAPVCEDGVLP